MEKKKRAIIGVVVFAILSTCYMIWEHFLNNEGMVVEASGTVEATTVELTAKVPGTIEIFNVKAGDSVQAEDLVAQIRRSDLEAQKERDALNVIIAQNKLDDLLSGARSQEIKEALANVNIKTAEYQKTSLDLKRADALFAEGSIAQAELEVYQNKDTVAFNQLEAAQARLSLLQAGSRAEQIKAAENQVKMAEAVLKATQAVLADLRIISPLAGSIQVRNYEVGEYVQAGASLATVANLDTVWINVYIPTDDLPYVKIGEKAKITISGMDKVFEGTITEIASHGEFTPKTIQTKKERSNIVYKVKIEVHNEEGILKPGMPADITIQKNLLNQDATKPDSSAENASDGKSDSKEEDQK